MIKPKVYLSDKEYKLVTDSVPIVCVDMVLYDKENKKAGFIKRGEKHALIGGRIGWGESIDEAVKRHLANDTGIGEFDYHLCSPEKPLFIHEYQKADNSKNEGKIGFDPTKHSIALTYALTTNQNPTWANEATGFRWATEEEVENIDFDFGQSSVIKKIFSLV